jgi:hypothetical protein
MSSGDHPSGPAGPPDREEEVAPGGKLGGAMAAYRNSAVILLNFVVLLLGANLVLGFGYAGLDRLRSMPRQIEAESGYFRDDGSPVDTPLRSRYQVRWFDYRAYERVPPEFVSRVLDDFYALSRQGFVYRPWVQFSEPPFSGQLVNIDTDESGFAIRRTSNAAAAGKPVARIYVFGGSSTFGYNVADEHTWPSHLARILNERARTAGLGRVFHVVNYGRGFYYSTQQAMLVADLLRAGYRPSVVVFMDGINCCPLHDSPRFTEELLEAFDAAQYGRDPSAADLLGRLHWIPMVRLSRSLNTRLSRVAESPAERADATGIEWDSTRIRWAVNQFVHSAKATRALCEAYGCEAMFFLQPHPLYRYDLDLYRPDLQAAVAGRATPIAAIYEGVRETGAYVDLSGLFEAWGAGRRAIVDDVHYSPGFNELLASSVADHIDIGNVALFDEVVDRQASTGAGW